MDERAVYLYIFQTPRGGEELCLYYKEMPKNLQLRTCPPVLGKTRLVNGWQDRSLTDITAEHNRRRRENDPWPNNTTPPPPPTAPRLTLEQMEAERAAARAKWPKRAKKPPPISPWQRITRDDVAVERGTVAPASCNGVPIPLSLRINSLTLREAVLRIAMRGERLLTREEAIALGYPGEEIDAVFGLGKPSP